MGSALVLCTRRTDGVRSGNKGTAFGGVAPIWVIVRSMLVWFNLLSLLSPQSVRFVEGSFLVPALWTAPTTRAKAEDTNACVLFFCSLKCYRNNVCLFLNLKYRNKEMILSLSNTFILLSTAGILPVQNKRIYGLRRGRLPQNDYLLFIYSFFWQS